MRCLICQHDECKVFMNKTFPKEFSAIKSTTYFICPQCSFVFSATHQRLSETDFKVINTECHRQYQIGLENLDDPKWLKRMNYQCDMIKRGVENKFIPNTSNSIKEVTAWISSNQCLSKFAGRLKKDKAVMLSPKRL